MGSSVGKPDLTCAVTKSIHNRSGLESPTREGNGPVGEMDGSAYARYPSNAGHVKSGMNLGGPPSKAKYSLVTDSEPVP